jgi:hypothetical protein
MVIYQTSSFTVLQLHREGSMNVALVVKQEVREQRGIDV